MEVLSIVVAIILLAFVFRLAAGGMDHARIRGYISERIGDNNLRESLAQHLRMTRHVQSIRKELS